MDTQKVVHQDQFKEKEINLVEVEEMDNQEEIGQDQDQEMKVQEGLQEMDSSVLFLLIVLFIIFNN